MAGRKNVDPFTDDVEEEKSAPANDKPAQPEATEKPAPRHDDVEVEVGDDDEEDDAPEQRAPRKERRANRFREVKEQAARAAEEARQAREELQRFQQQYQLQQQYAQQYQAAPPQQPQADPYEEQVNSTYHEQQALEAEYARLPDDQKQAKLAEYQKRFRDAEQKRYQLIARREMEQSGGGGYDPAAVQQQVIQAQLQAAAPDIMGNQQYAAYARAEWERQKALGKTPDWNLVHQCFEETRKAFRLPGTKPAAPRVQEAARHKYTGVSAGGGGAPARKSVTLTKAEQKMARALYPKDDEGVAYQKFAKKVMSRDGE